MLALDGWNGTQPQVEQFIAVTGVTYPVLRSASLATGGNIYTLYETSYEAIFVVDAEGIIRYRKTTGTVPRWDPVAVGAAVDQALADLLTPAGPAAPSRKLTLAAPYPNPFNPTTTVPYTLQGPPGAVAVRLRVLDVHGRVVRTLVDAIQQRGGSYQATWDGRDERGLPLASGTYIVHLEADTHSQSRLLSLVK